MTFYDGTVRGVKSYPEEAGNALISGLQEVLCESKVKAGLRLTTLALMEARHQSLVLLRSEDVHIPVDLVKGWYIPRL